MMLTRKLLRSYSKRLIMLGRLGVARHRRRAWPYVRPLGYDRRVGVAFVSYNTHDLTAQLLFSLFRVLGKDQLAAVVAVDNNSTDGSVELLRTFARAGHIELIENRTQRYHGPGLNQAVNRLVALRELRVRFDYIWVLDSDAFVLREDAYRAARDSMKSTSAAMLGQYQYDALAEGYAHPSSLLLDPSKAWRWPVVPFEHSGSPAVSLNRSLRKHGLGLEEFPFRTDNYVLHLGRGTVRQVVLSGESSNRHFAEAQKHKRTVFHYHGNSDGEAIYERFLEEFRTETGDVTPTNVLAACERAGRIDLGLAEAHS